MRLGELAQSTGVPRRTLQRWVERGLLVPTRAYRRAQRRYDATDVARAAFIQALRDEGIGVARAVRALDRYERLLEVSRVPRGAGGH